AIGIDQDFFVCAREDHINDSDFKQYKDLLFGPVQGSTGSSWEAGRGMAGAGRVFGAVAERMAEGNIAGGASSASVMNGRHMETIYRDFIKNLAEQCEVGALKDIKTYTKLYKERFPGGDYYTSIGAYTKTYKDCVNLKNKVQTLRQVNEYEQFKDVFETARSEIAASAASYDLTFAVQAYDSARNSVLYYVFGTTSAGGDIRSEAKKDADANYVIAIKDYGKFVGDYISAMHKIATYYGTGDGTKADRAAMYVSNAKSITSDDIEEADQFARVLRNKGETAVAQAFCIEANKAGPDKISYFIPGKTQVCSIS
ncbi:MAG: hypothetical protein KJ574_04750, partial [Nanoarchaeota archaeon]|nr:hypothetical protein [Nanoarchaeota archaeon]